MKMGTKFVFFTAFALFTIQGLESKQLEFDELNSNHIDDFLKLIDENDQNIITVIAKGTVKISKQFSDVIGKAKIKRQEVLDEMKEIEENETTKFNKKATESGQNTIECKLKREIYFSLIKAQVFENMGKCLKHPEQMFQNMREHIKGAMDKKFKTVDGLCKEIKKCESVKCKAAIITKGTEVMHESYNKIKKIVETATVNLSSVLSNVCACICDENDYFKKEIIGKTCIDMESIYKIKENTMSDDFQERTKGNFESSETGILLDVVIQEMSQKVDKILIDSINDIRKQFFETQKAIEMVISTAKGDGVRKCDEAQRERCEELLFNMHANMKICSGVATDIIEEMIVEPEKLIDEIMEEFIQLAEEFKNCDKHSCRDEIFSDMKEVKTQITKIVEEFIPKIKEVIPVVEQCVKVKQENFQADSRNILVDIHKCINDNNERSLLETLTTSEANAGKLVTTLKEKMQRKKI